MPPLTAVTGRRTMKRLGPLLIKEAYIRVNRSLGPDVCIRPGPPSILIGPNGSGKSNVLDVFPFVCDAVTQGLPAAITHPGGIDSVRRRTHARPFDVHIDEQSLALTALGGTRPFKPLVDFLTNMSVYSIFPDTLRVPQRLMQADP